MKNFLTFIVLLIITVWFVRNRNFSEVRSEDLSAATEVNDNDQSVVQDENLIEKADMELKSFFSEDSICVGKSKEYEKLINTVDNYVQRYISLFLRASNLLDYKVKDEEEEILMDLEISIKGRDLSYLQEYSMSSKSSAYLKNFNKLDSILSKIAREKERSYMEKATRSFFAILKSFMQHFHITNALSNPSLYPFYSLTVILILTWTFYCFFFKYMLCFLGIVINSFILWEGLISYWQKIKESKLEIFLDTLYSNNRPEVCDPSKQSWYDLLVNVFYKNRCLEYYKKLQRSPVEEVSFLNCIIDRYSFYFVRTPLKLLGTSVKDITGEISGLLPWPFNHILSIPLGVVILVASLFFILVLCGKKLKLSFCGGGFEIGDTQTKPAEQKPAVSFSYDSPKPVRVIRKLKPWTKSRFPKRVEGTGRKVYLKDLKFTSKGEETVSSNSSSSSSKAITSTDAATS